MLKFFRNLRYKKMIRTSSSFILEELANIVNDAIGRLEKDGRIRSPLHKEVLKFESTALVFWLFRGSSLFPEPWHKLVLDEVHNQYYARLRKHGYDRSMVQAICDDFNLRYRTYDKFADSAGDFVKVGTSFAGFVSERSKTDRDLTAMATVAELLERTVAKISEFREVVK